MAGGSEAYNWQRFCLNPPVYRSHFIELHRVSDPSLSAEVTEQADEIVRAVLQWLGYSRPVAPARLVIFSPEEPEGWSWLRAHPQGGHRAGGMLADRDCLLVVGDPADSRFWTVLRHESAHYALHATVDPDATLPFWLNEGVACLFEAGLDHDGRPRPSPERETLLRYLAQTRSSLHLKRVLQTDAPARPSGRDYARAWGIVAYLYDRDRSPSGYLDALRVQDGHWLARFEVNLFGEEEGMEAFEAAVQRWVEARSLN